MNLVKVRNDCDEKDEDVPEEVILAKKLCIKGTLRDKSNTENTKDSMREADRNLEVVGQLPRHREDVCLYYMTRKHCSYS